MSLKSLVVVVALSVPCWAAAQDADEMEQLEIQAGYLHVLEVDGQTIKIQLHDPWAAQLPRILGQSLTGLDEKTAAALTEAIEKYLTDTDFAAKIDDEVAHLPATEIRNQLQYLLGEIRKGDVPMLRSVPVVPEGDNSHRLEKTKQGAPTETQAATETLPLHGMKREE